MKECKVIRRSSDDLDYIEKSLRDYLNSGFEVKHMTQDGRYYTFYLEQDVQEEGENA